MKGDLIKLARFLIEPRETQTRYYDEHAEEIVNIVFKKLTELLRHYSILTSSQQPVIEKSLGEKLWTCADMLKEILQSIENKPGFISVSGALDLPTKLDIQLSTEELDYCVLMMYNESKNVEELPYECLIKLASKSGQNESEPQEAEEIKKEGLAPEQEQKPVSEEEKYEEEKFEEENNNKMKSKSKAESNKNEKEEECIDITEDQMIEIAQKCFHNIAEKIKEKNITINELYKDVIKTKKIEGEQVQVLAPTDFIKGLQQLGIGKLQTIEEACLIQVLSISEDLNLIKVEDINQILEDYNGKGNEIQENREEDYLGKIKELDKVSMVLMLAFTEYIIKANVPLYELFGDAIFKQSEDSEDIISSDVFFKTLHDLGIKTEETEHDNLKTFLCLNNNEHDKLSVNKLKDLIEQFAVNENLRAYAHECYKELLENDEYEDEDEQEDDPNGIEYEVLNV